MQLFEDVFEQFPQLRLPLVDDSLYYFDPVEADNTIQFFHNELTHVEGPLKGEQFMPERWQQYVIATAYGWKRKTFDEDDEWICTPTQIENDVRKFRDIFVFIPRKNGKSFMGAGAALKGLIADKEPGARVVSAAADTDQAALIFDTAKEIVLNNPNMTEVQCYKRTMAIPADGANYRVISAEAGTKHGKNLSTVIIDELHAQPDRELVDVLFTSVGARAQPLKWNFTTAGYDKQSICYQTYDYAKRVQKGLVINEEFFAVIFEADESDDWKDEKTWFKVNPNLGISIQLDYFRSEFKKACEQPGYENTFKRLHLNMWTEQDVRWLPVEDWDACKDPEFNIETLKGKDCFAGIDLSAKKDTTSVVLAFLVGEDVHIVPHFWVPEDAIQRRIERDRVDYSVWIRQGLITAVPGAVIRYSFIQEYLRQMRKLYNIRQLGTDPWNAQDFMETLRLEDDFDVVEIEQNAKNLSDATKSLEGLILGRKLKHDGNAVMRWQFGNVGIVRDANDNIRISKKENISRDRVDGMAALVNALSRLFAPDQPQDSVYKTRGVRSIG